LLIPALKSLTTLGPQVVVGRLHYLHFGVLVFILTGIMTVIISLLTEPIPGTGGYYKTFFVAID
jgi:hypothetical protein